MTKFLGNEVVSPKCRICGHPLSAHKNGCLPTCAGCGRHLEYVAEGAMDECPDCIRFLETQG